MFYEYKSLGSHIKHFFIVFVLMLFEKRVVDEFLDRGPLAGVLLQAPVQEVPDLCAHEQVGRDLNLILHDLNELLFASDLEGVLPNDHLVHHDPNRPNVYLFVVLPPLEDLRADIQRSSAEGRPEFVVLVHGPAEVAQFDNVLTKTALTSCSTIF